MNFLERCNYCLIEHKKLFFLQCIFKSLVFLYKIGYIKFLKKTIKNKTPILLQSKELRDNISTNGWLLEKIVDVSPLFKKMKSFLHKSLLRFLKRKGKQICNAKYSICINFWKIIFVFLNVRHFETTLWNISCHCQGFLTRKQNNKLDKSCIRNNHK